MQQKATKSMFPVYAFWAAMIPAGAPGAARAMALDMPDGTIEVSGHGSAAAKPELAHLQTRVTSRCNETSMGAKDSNAILANKILSILQPYLAASAEIPGLEPLTATSGSNIRQTEYTGYGNEAKVLCEHKWRASEVIRVVITDLDKLPRIQDELLKMVDAESSMEQLPQTWAEVDAPQFGLKAATMTRLKVEAQQSAWLDARGKVDVLGRSCQFQGLRLIKASEPSFSAAPVYKVAAMSAADSAETPMLPGAISVSAQWNFVWGYDPVPGGSCPR